MSSVPRATVVSEVWTVSSAGTGVEAKTCCPFESRTMNEAIAGRSQVDRVEQPCRDVDHAARVDERRVGRHRHDRDELAAGRERPDRRLGDSRRPGRRRGDGEAERRQLGGRGRRDGHEEVGRELVAVERDRGLAELARHARRQAREAQVVGRRLGADVVQLDRELDGRLRLGDLAVGRQGDLEVPRGQGRRRGAEVVERVAQAGHRGLDGGGRRGRGQRVPAGGQVGDEHGQDRIGGEQAQDAVEARQRLALGDGARRVLHEARQGDAEVVEPVGEGGVAELRRPPRRRRSPSRRGRRRVPAGTASAGARRKRH